MNLTDYMKMKIMQGMLAGIVASLIGVGGLIAGAAEGKEEKLPRSQVEAVNFTNMTFTVARKETNLVLQITAETRFFTNDKPAISKSLQVGDHVRGTIRRLPDSVPVALRVQIEKPAPK